MIFLIWLFLKLQPQRNTIHDTRLIPFYHISYPATASPHTLPGLLELTIHGPGCTGEPRTGEWITAADACIHQAIKAHTIAESTGHRAQRTRPQHPLTSKWTNWPPWPGSCTGNLAQPTGDSMSMARINTVQLGHTAKWKYSVNMLFIYETMICFGPNAIRTTLINDRDYKGDEVQLHIHTTYIEKKESPLIELNHSTEMDDRWTDSELSELVSAHWTNCVKPR